MARQGEVRIGTSGWIYRHWRGVFYPEKLPVSRWFGYYSEHFDTVEINNSFYRLPSAEVFQAWRRQAPEGFLYAVKATRFLTHRKKLKDPEQPLQNFLVPARHLGPRLGPLLFQLPPRWHCDLERLRRFVALLPRDLTHVFEFRDPSWYNPGVKTLLEEEGMGFCIHDMRESASPVWVTGPVAYVRFHGPTAVRYAGKYTPAQLQSWAERIEAFRTAGHDVYVYFNNDDAAHAVVNAGQLQELLGVAPLVR